MLVVDACGPKKILGELSQLLDAHSVLYLLVEHGGAKDDSVSAQRGVAAMARLVQMPSLRVLHSHSIDDTVAFLGSIARCGVRWHIGVFLAVFVVIFLASYARSVCAGETLIRSLLRSCCVDFLCAGERNR